MNSYAKTDSSIFTLLALVMVSLSIFLFAPGAFAFTADDDEVSMAVVKFQDLDVNSAAGAATLYWRIHRAANLVCGVNEHSVLPSQPRLRCAKDAEARAVAQVNIPRLTAYYQTKTGNLPPSRISMAK
jgi:UrcA family protein